MRIHSILFIISLVYIIFAANKTGKETFGQDISNNKKPIIYDTVPYGNSGLFYDYVLASPYWYNPLDYWLNPYFYYNTWYGPNRYWSTGSSSSSVYVPQHRNRHYVDNRHHRHFRR